MIARSELVRYYVEDKLSMAEIARILDCSMHKFAYWMDKYSISRRSTSDAVYQRANPDGDPFTAIPVTTKKLAELHGVGIGLHWGEGTKASRYSVRIGNTDPALICKFMTFLKELYGVDKSKLKFSLQIFSDTSTRKALDFWTKELGVKDSQFGNVVVTVSGSLGTYRHKSEYGVATLYFHNKKLRDIIVGLLPR